MRWRWALHSVYGVLCHARWGLRGVNIDILAKLSRNTEEKWNLVSRSVSGGVEVVTRHQSRPRGEGGLGNQRMIEYTDGTLSIRVRGISRITKATAAIFSRIIQKQGCSFETLKRISIFLLYILIYIFI